MFSMAGSEVMPSRISQQGDGFRAVLFSEQGTPKVQ